MKLFVLFFSGLWMLSCGLQAAGSGLLNNDPDVVYFEGKKTVLLVVKPATVFASKNGGRRMGAFPVDAKVELLAMTDKGYKVKGKAQHGMVTGWVSPRNMASRDPQFVANLKAHYTRSLEIQKIIAAKEVAIGMTVDEVKQSIGKPTKQESRLTKDGRSGKWEFVKSEEQKHYVNSIDRKTGQIFRRYSHTTQEVREKLTVEFEKDVVTAISSLKDDSAGNVRIVVPPVIFRF